MRFNRLNLTILMAGLCCWITSAAQTVATSPVYKVNPEKSIHQLQSVTTMLIDSARAIADSNIINGSLDRQFRARSAGEMPMRSGNIYWQKFTITNTSAIKDWWLILFLQNDRQYYSMINYMDVYQVSKGRVHHEKAGDFVPRSKRSVKETPTINRVLLSMAAGDTQTVYVKLYNEYQGSSSLPVIELRDPSIQLPMHDLSTPLIVSSAIMLTLCILSLCFFFFIRDKAYLFFSGYLIALALHYQILNPASPLINRLMPEHPYLIVYLWRVLTMGAFFCFLLFGRSFISLKTLSKTTDVFLKWFLRIWIAITLINFGLMYFLKRDLLDSSLFFLFFFGMLGFLIRIAFFKNILARFYVAGALWLITFSILGGLWNQGIISLPMNPWLTAQYGQLLIYCFGLAYKVRLNERAKAEADHIKGLDEIKSRFFANISHEFRTPLTLIRGPLQQIEEEAAKNNKNGDAIVSVQSRKIQTMRRHTDRLLELVNQLLDLSRLDSGKMKLQVAKGDVIQVLKTIAGSFESMAERKQIHYYVQFPEQSALCYFDRDKLEKIITNLLGNAFKYTPEKGTVSLIAEIDERRLRLSVEDSGPGISKKELDKVFDRFYQAEGNEDKGSGIGLALVKELADLYRGQISVSSEPGKGSRFRVSLPIDHASFKQEELLYTHEAKDHEPVTNDWQSDETVNTATASSAALPILLVVEDNADLRNHINEIVQQQYRVLQAVNGKEGFEMAVQEIPDIVISDVMMPLMDGFTLAQKLKKDERTSHVPIILLTAKAGQAHKIEGLETGADDYLTKPFDHKELLTRVRNLINQRKLLRKKFAGDIILKPSEVSVNSADENFLAKVMQAIEVNMGEEDFGVEELAKEVAMSRSQLHRKLIALTGQSPSEVLRNTRLLRAKELLQKKAATPGEVAFRVGFNSHTYFSKCFKEEFGVSPSEV